MPTRSASTATRAARIASSWWPRIQAGGKTLTRRLLYTAISRAQERCYCLGPGAAFLTAAQTAPKRATLLRGLLEAGPQPVAAPAPKPVLRKSSAQFAEVAARMAALNPVRRDHEPIEQQKARPRGRASMIGKPGRGKVAAALGI